MSDADGILTTVCPSARVPPASAGFWLTHAWLPGVALTILALVFALTDADRAIASAWAWDPAAAAFRGAGPGEWWAREVIHAGGGAAIRAIGVATLGLWLLALRSAVLQPLRRPLAYTVAATLAVIVLIGIAKNTTNIDCPWALTDFGGDRPYVHLFGDRPDDLPRAQCFPGGHSSSGFALLALYFALRDRRPRAARWFLGGALAVGTLFAFGQEARGAHFLSHDLWSLGIAWFTCLAVYRLAFGGRVWSPLPGPPRAT